MNRHRLKCVMARNMFSATLAWCAKHQTPIVPSLVARARCDSLTCYACCPGRIRPSAFYARDPRVDNGTASHGVTVL